jgi:hypothetical protein
MPVCGDSSLAVYGAFRLRLISHLLSDYNGHTLNGFLKATDIPGHGQSWPDPWKPPCPGKSNEPDDRRKNNREPTGQWKSSAGIARILLTIERTARTKNATQQRLKREGPRIYSIRIRSRGYPGSSMPREHGELPSLFRQLTNFDRPRSLNSVVNVDMTYFS